MSSKQEERQFISSYFNVLRFLQEDHWKERMTVEAIRNSAEISRTTADKIVNEFKSIGIINKNLAINATYAVFMGICVSYDGITISVVGLDGKEISWKEIIKQYGILTEFNGKIEAEYSIRGLTDASNTIKEILYRIKQIFLLMAVCFSFDDVDLKRNTFSYSSYTIDKNEEYNIQDFCKLYMGDVLQDIEVRLEANAMSQLIAKEFPLKAKNNSSIYIDIQKDGIFAALILQNKISYGYNLQSLRLSKALNDQERNDFEDDSIKGERLIAIGEKLIRPFLISLNPELVSVSGPIVQENETAFNYIIFQKARIIEESGARNYYPNIKIDMESRYSKGAAISAMYHYYQWDGTCIKHFE